MLLQLSAFSGTHFLEMGITRLMGNYCSTGHPVIEVTVVAGMKSKALQAMTGKAVGVKGVNLIRPVSMNKASN